jgi:hypothetical protein
VVSEILCYFQSIYRCIGKNSMRKCHSNISFRCLNVCVVMPACLHHHSPCVIRRVKEKERLSHACKLVGGYSLILSHLAGTQPRREEWARKKLMNLQKSHFTVPPKWKDYPRVALSLGSHLFIKGDIYLSPNLDRCQRTHFASTTPPGFYHSGRKSKGWALLVSPWREAHCMSRESLENCTV